MNRWIARARVERARAREPDLPIIDPHHIVALAACPSAVVQLGGLGMLIFGFDLRLRDAPPSSAVLAETWKPFLEPTIEAFGASREIYESNFPEDKQSCDDTACGNAFKLISAGASAADKAALFHDTAARVYRI